MSVRLHILVKRMLDLSLGAARVATGSAERSKVSSSVHSSGIVDTPDFRGDSLSWNVDLQFYRQGNSGH